MAADQYEIRTAVPADRPAIVALLAASLGRDDDPRFGALFDWKHLRNAFGPSLAYVAVTDGEVAGFRAFMQWRYRRGTEVVRAVRAVDTATHPDHQGRGLFTRLTTHALDEARAQGFGFVFNTPNEQSRPGYLKMGWEVVGRIPIAVRPRTPAATVRMLRAHAPAERWSEPSDAGIPVEDVLDDAAIEHLLESQPSPIGLRTDRSIDYFRWRYVSSGLGYRAIVAAGGVSEGLAVFRVRRRGAAREVVLDEILTPGADPRAIRGLTQATAREARGDYLIGAASARAGRHGTVPLPRQGPILTWRSLMDTNCPPLRSWDLTMGDIELF